MTVSTTTAKVSYTGNGSTTGFAVPFVFFGSDELEVIERTIATGAEVVKALTTHYTVSGGNGATGTVTAVTAPASTVEWHIRRKTARTQLVDYQANDAFPADTHERALDRAAARDQEIEETVGRALVFPKTDSASLSPILPSSVVRAGMALGFDANGNPVALATQPDSLALPIAVAHGGTGASTAAAAIAALGGLPAAGGAMTGAINEAKGADLVSASTTDIGAATGDYVVVTGTTTITALGTVQAGTVRRVRFGGSLKLTHNASSLILPGAADIQTAAGDIATFVSEGAGNWRCASYQRASFIPSALPIGTILSYGGTSAPTGWLLCYGQNVSRATYAALFAVIGTAFGAGDGSTTFGVPDLRGRVTVGKDDMGGSAASRVTSGVSGISGATLGAAGGDERLHAHTHTENQVVAGTGLSSGANFTGSSGNTGTAGAGGSQNMPPSLVVNRIIFAGA